MKKALLLVISLLFFSSIGFADDIDVKINKDSNNVLSVYANVFGVALTRPLGNVDLTPYWRSIQTKDEFVGIQTILASFPNKDVPVYKSLYVPKYYFKFSVGEATSFKSNSLSYASIMFSPWKFTAEDGTTLIYTGVGYGRDFEEHKDHLLIGATYPLGDIWTLIASKLKM